jgi:hypothetical protein
VPHQYYYTRKLTRELRKGQKAHHNRVIAEYINLLYPKEERDSDPEVDNEIRLTFHVKPDLSKVYHCELLKAQHERIMMNKTPSKEPVV